MKDFWFGFFLATSVGPVAVLIVGYAIRIGLRAAASAALAAAAADGIYALLAFSIGAAISSFLSAYELVLRLAGSMILIFMGARMMRSALSSRKRTSLAENGTTNEPFASVFLMTLANPLTILLFYGYACSLAPPEANWLTGASCVFLGSLIGQFIFVVAGHTLAPLFRSNLLTGSTSVLTGAVVILYGVLGCLSLHYAIDRHPS
jgi:threonine/homoserine/homoserine lactone efflux protein